MPCGCNQLLEPDTQTEFTVCDNGGSLAYTERGSTPLVQGSPVLTVAFTVPKASEAYSFIELAIENLVDPNALSLSAEVVFRTVSGFTVDIDGLPDSANYTLRWNVYVTNITI